MLMILFVFLVCIAASTVGAICGIGGGVIIKPVLEATHIMSVSEVSFLSGCTVLCMSAYSVLSGSKKNSTPLEKKSILPLAVGAAFGGLFGKLLYKSLAGGDASAAAAQSAVLFLLLLGTFVYTLCEKRIKTHRLDSGVLSALIGLALGFFSSFLGIGGGPFNLVILSFCFSMDTKTAARHSLVIILISQAVSVLYSLLSKSVPDVSLLMLVVMAAGGIGGGVIGRKVNKKLTGEGVHKLFLALTLVILGISAYNFATALGAI